MHRNYGLFSGVVKDLIFFPGSYQLLTSLLALILLYYLITSGTEDFFMILQFQSMSLLHFLCSYIYIKLFCLVIVFETFSHFSYPIILGVPNIIKSAKPTQGPIL